MVFHHIQWDRCLHPDVQKTIDINQFCILHLFLVHTGICEPNYDYQNIEPFEIGVTDVSGQYPFQSHRSEFYQGKTSALLQCAVALPASYNFS